jgi:hypothetical protein
MKNNFLAFVVSIFLLSCSESGNSIESTENNTSSSSGSSSNSNCPTKNCADFATRAQAQATYNSNKNCYKNLDADGDGIACENLK